MSDVAFNAMMTEVDGFSYDQCVALLARLSQVFRGKKREAAAEMSPIDRFFGTVSDEDSEKMLVAVKECRRIEPRQVYAILPVVSDSRCDERGGG